MAGADSRRLDIARGDGCVLDEACDLSKKTPETHLLELYIAQSLSTRPPQRSTTTCSSHHAHNSISIDADGESPRPIGIKRCNLMHPRTIRLMKYASFACVLARYRFSRAARCGGLTCVVVDDTHLDIAPGKRREKGRGKKRQSRLMPTRDLFLVLR